MSDVNLAARGRALNGSGARAVRVVCQPLQRCSGSLIRVPFMSPLLFGLAVVDVRKATRLALAVGGVYLVLGAAWIGLSDAALQLLTKAAPVPLAGWRVRSLGFLLVTAAALVLLVRFGALRLLAATQARQSSETTAHELFLHHPQPMFLFDRETQAIVQANAAAVRRYGWTEAELKALTLTDLLAEEGAPGPQGSAPAQPLPVFGDLGVQRHRRKSGAPIHVQVSVHPLQVAGRRTALAMAIDVSSEVRARAEVERQAWLHRQLHQSLSEVLWLARVDGREVLYVSPAFESLYGLPAQALRDDPQAWLAWVHPDDRQRAASEAQRLLVDGESQCRYRLRRPDGSVRWVADRKRVLRDEQGQAFMIGGIAEDITLSVQTAQALQQRTDELAQRNAELERFSRVMVGRELDMIALKHEINRLRSQLGELPSYAPPAEVEAQR